MKYNNKIRQQLQLLKMINKNARNSFDERAKMRSQKANINIQINFNMKDKAQGFGGKKIDNYVEIEQKSINKVDSHPKNNDDLKKIKKKNNQHPEKIDKDKFQTPNKYKNQQAKGVKTNPHQKTPERKSIQRREEKSKSTNQKLVKRKNAKSVQNIRAAAKNTKKTISPQSSGEKSRSHSKSSKKLLRSSDSSLKNLFVFSNSGIKNKMKKGNNQSRQRIVSKKPLQQDHDKIKKFMEQKKKKQKQQKLKQIKQQKVKKEKLAEELRKVQVQRKANASKTFIPSKKYVQEKPQRFPIFFDDDQLDDSNGFDNLRRQAEKLIHDSPTPKNTIETIPISKIKDYQRGHNSSGKKTSKKHAGSQLVHKYINGTITQKQVIKLIQHVIKIQSFWRGYATRKLFAKRLSDETTRIRYIKNRIQNKKGNFWNEQENSIVNIQKNTQIKIQDESSSQRFFNYASNGNSNVSQNSINSKLISSKGDRYKKLSIQLEEEGEQEAERLKQKEQNQRNLKMLRQIEELKKMLEQQNLKYRSLEEQNQNLKRNIKVLGVNQRQEDLMNSIDFIEIRMPKKIQSPIQRSIQKKRQQVKNLQINKQINLNYSPQPLPEVEKRSIDLESLKKQFQAFQCSSPSNAVLQEQLRSLKNKNIEGIFKKKEITVQEKYVKKYQMFDKMLSDRLFSPRTYNMKKKELEIKLSSQIDQIKNRKEQAKRVIGFIKDIGDAQEEQTSIRSTSYGQKQEEHNFKKEKSVRQLKDTFTNTSPIQIKPSQFKAKNKLKLEKDSNSSNSSNEEYYKKYWNQDLQEKLQKDHQFTLQNLKKIDQALRDENSDGTSKRDEQGSSQYNSVGREQQQPQGDYKEKRRLHERSNSNDGEINLATLKQSYEDYLEQYPSQTQRKAKEIFNKIDLSQCKSEEDLQSSHQNICKLLNTNVFQPPNHSQIKQVDNLYISEADFNNKKRKQQELSRSSSFEKSNKSLSVSNSQVQAKGFITNLTFIKEFCISVCEYIRNIATFKESFVSNISQTIKFDFAQYLKAYRITLNGQIKNNYNTYSDQYLYHYFKIVSSKDQAISHDLFTNFMKSYEQEKTGCPDWNKPYYNKEIKQMREYFLISIIDSFNESLQFEKPGSIYGEPFPWMNNSNRLKNYGHSRLTANLGQRHDEYEQETDEDKKLDQIFGSSIAKIIQWGSFLCGFIADPMPMQMGDSEIANLSDEQLGSIRQNRIGLMLQKWLLEQQQKITNSTSQYTEVLLNLGQKIIQALILQCSQELQQF